MIEKGTGLFDFWTAHCSLSFVPSIFQTLYDETQGGLSTKWCTVHGINKLQMFDSKKRKKFDQYEMFLGCNAGRKRRKVIQTFGGFQLWGYSSKFRNVGPNSFVYVMSIFGDVDQNQLAMTPALCFTTTMGLTFSRKRIMNHCSPNPGPL